MKLLTYNCQKGSQGIELIRKLLANNCDLFCFQRFPKDWLAEFPEFIVSFQPSYPNAAFGCATFSHSHLESEGGFTMQKTYGDTCQSNAFLKVLWDGVVITNTLPPFDEQSDFYSHVEFLKTHSSAKNIIVGDFHNNDNELPKNLFFPFKNYSQKINFYGRHLESSNLSKLLSNVPIKMNSETIVPLSKEAVKHLPVQFDFIFEN